MRSEPGHDQLAAGPATVQPGASRAGQVALITGGSAGLGLAIGVILPVDGGWTAH